MLYSLHCLLSLYLRLCLSKINVPSIYNHRRFEEKWLLDWERRQLFQGRSQPGSASRSEKLYLLFAFAYPSGSGLHVGHVESKTALDILARFYRMNGRQVLFPVGWDAFGLPAENYAIKTGVHPAQTTRQAIDTFRRQIKRIGVSYDWTNEIATCHPEYYRWTQWLFLQLYGQDLAYQATGMVNWCPSCQTVLANEQVVDGHCERCDHQVVQREMKQWFFRITKYREELIGGLEEVDWPEPTKQQQLNWIGKKEGINVEYPVEGTAATDLTVNCFTTRPDTNFGATFVVVAPEHRLARDIAAGLVKPDTAAVTHRRQVSRYLRQTERKTERERQQEGRRKTGVFTGLYALNRLTGQRMPIWVSDFVLRGFGTGAVVGVPGHDRRDFEFAQTFKLPVKRVVVAPDGDGTDITSLDQVQEEAGVMLNSGFLDGLEISQAIPTMMDYLEKRGWGQRQTAYRLRDWLISRQRYWGTPIPIVYDPEGRPHPVKEEHLPWLLPTDVDYQPQGKPPLASSREFIERTERLYGPGWRPEFDTMDTFVDSSWYYLRYVDPRHPDRFASAEQLRRWLPVDFYMIGPEHIVLHLLYSRFFTKFLRDQGYFKFGEPFTKMRHQGIIMGPDGKRMSKSRGNVISPDQVIDKFGADTLRVYEMFMGPIETDKPWDDSAVAGVYRFLGRVHDLVSQAKAVESTADEHPAVQRKLHQVIRKLSADIPALKFNTAIAALMELTNLWEDVSRRGRQAVLARASLINFVQLLAPLAPFLAEELYSQLEGEADSVHLSDWPTWDDRLAAEPQVSLPVQVNGKIRAQLKVPAEQLGDTSQILEQAQRLPAVQRWLGGEEPSNSIYVPGRIVSLVTGPVGKKA